VPEIDPEVPWYLGPVIRAVEKLMMWL
jgi:hypothetical protein